MKTDVVVAECEQDRFGAILFPLKVTCKELCELRSGYVCSRVREQADCLHSDWSDSVKVCEGV